MKNLSFTELYNIKDMLNDQIRNETDNDKLKKLIKELQIVRKALSNKRKEIIKKVKEILRKDK